MEGRVVKAAGDMCKALDIYNTIMRQYGAACYPKLFTFQEHQSSLLSRKEMNIFFVSLFLINLPFPFNMN
jgi:hypothetical protein